ncbi:MFS transporter [Bifidobacterium callimiconis]|uniref:MFS transporter n=1 Tax=Bifidobacterium callimiconis TaxID=2306973 RepID=A0A430FBJ6_9BIFI|nr:MFS transporter [Bifidobacterium callimiconis]RSX50162.1 MFS transporter [Bifidobacterium callimiconis]
MDSSYTPSVNLSKEKRLAAHNAAVSAASENPVLSPETGRPVSKLTYARFGAGFLLFGVLWMSGLCVVSAVILPQHLKEINAGSPEALMGVINACTAVASLLANVIFGNFSDRSRSRLGRRTPWIIAGGFLGGVTLFLTGIMTNPVLLTICYCLSMVGLNMMIAPLVAVISDRVPQGTRGTMSAFYGGGSAIGAPIGTMLGSLFITNMFPGLIVAGVLMALSGAVSVAIMPSEESADYLPQSEGGLKDVLVSFRPPKFGDNHDFYKAFGGRLCMLLSYQMISAYQLYIVQDYVGMGVQESAVVVSVMSTITLIVGLIGSLGGGPISDLIGRRKVPVVVASLCFATGVAMPLVMPSAMGMYLFAGIAGLGYAVYGSVDQALNVDVLSSKEEAGKDLGILNLATTLGQMAGPIITSSVVVATGTYMPAFFISIAFAVLGCVFIMAIKAVK